MTKLIFIISVLVSSQLFAGGQFVI